IDHSLGSTSGIIACALRNFDLEETENGNSFKPVAQTTTNDVGTSTTLIPGLVTTEEKSQKKNDVKARSMLLMALPHEHQMTFNKYKDAKSLFATIETRFGGNEATKKTLLKQMYENFSATSIDLPYEWNTYVVWRNKPDLDIMNIDDLYNNFKIVEQEKITINGSDTAGFDKSKVKCYNCHKMRYFSRECRGPRNQYSINMYQDRSGRSVNVEETPPKAIVAIDGVGFDWSYMAEDELDLSNSGLEEFKQPQFESYGPKSCEKESKNASEDIPNERKEYLDAPLVKDRVSDNKDRSVESPVVVEKKTNVPTIAKVEFVRPKQQEKPVRKPVKCAEMYRSQGPKGNQINWNNLKSQQLGSNFVMYYKACFVCGSFNHGHPQKVQEDQGYVDSGCSRHMTVNISYLSEFKKFDRGYVTFGGGANSGRITGKGTLKTGKFDGKADEGYFVGYSMNSKAFRVYNIRTKRVEENLHIEFLENKPIVACTNSDDFTDGSPLFDSSLEISGDSRKKHNEVSNKEIGASNELNYAFENLNTKYTDDLKMPGLDTTTTYDDSEEEADFTNLESSIDVSPTPTSRTYKNHPLKQVIGSLNTPIQIGSKLKPTNEQGFISVVYEGKTHEDLNTYVFACFLSQIEPTRVAKALSDLAWMDANSAFLYERIEEEVYVYQPLGFKDPNHPEKVYKVVKAVYGLHQALRAWLMKDKFQMSSMGELTFFLGLQVKQKEDGIFISQDKYVTEVLRKFNFSDVKSANTPVDTEKTLVKDVDVHLYRSMIRPLMYITASRPDIMYALCVCARFQVTPKCKKQTLVATSTTEDEYVAAASCYGQVL
nr:retrovirus-related Pol polyprotein from transposon TNT 1-94 [Tanacetum cinerariifolium]